MAKFRKRPIIIEAFQLTKESRIDNTDWPEWMNAAWNREQATINSLFPTNLDDGCGTLSIMTLEGEMVVEFEDWIIRGIEGELYPCKPNIFMNTYDLVE